MKRKLKLSSSAKFANGPKPIWGSIHKYTVITHSEASNSRWVLREINILLNDDWLINKTIQNFYPESKNLNDQKWI